MNNIINDLVKENIIKEQKLLSLAKENFEPLKNLYFSIKNDLHIEKKFFGLSKEWSTVPNNPSELIINYTLHYPKIMVEVVFEMGKISYHYSPSWDKEGRVAGVSKFFILSDLDPEENIKTSTSIQTFIEEVVQYGKKYKKIWEK